jgi:hypothetical protein
MNDELPGGKPPIWVRAILAPTRTRRGAVVAVSVYSAIGLSSLIWVWLGRGHAAVPGGVTASLLGAWAAIAIQHADAYRIWPWFSAGAHR